MSLRDRAVQVRAVGAILVVALAAAGIIWLSRAGTPPQEEVERGEIETGQIEFGAGLAPPGVKSSFNADTASTLIQVVDPDVVDDFGVYLYQATTPDSCFLVDGDQLMYDAMPNDFDARFAIRARYVATDPQLLQDMKTFFDGLIPITRVSPWVVSQDCGDVSFVRMAQPDEVEQWLQEIDQQRPKPTAQGPQQAPPEPSAEVPPEILQTSLNADQSTEFIQVADFGETIYSQHLFQATTPATCRVASLPSSPDTGDYSHRDLARLYLRFEHKLTDEFMNVSDLFMVARSSAWILTSGCGVMHYVGAATWTDLAPLYKRLTDLVEARYGQS